jgi:hypothetical protein
MPEWVTLREAVSPEALATLRGELVESPLVSRSTLAGSFQGSRGFAVTFRRDGVPKVLARFPALAPFFGRAVTPDVERVLQPWHARLLHRPLPALNGFYLNLLMLRAGDTVGRHVDATLRAPSREADAVPRVVSVLYLEVPPAVTGGRLLLFRGERPVAAISPEPGMLVHFRGELAHAVEAFDGNGSAALRVSLVCEQYAFKAEACAKLPEAWVQSKAGFQAYLEARERR